MEISTFTLKKPVWYRIYKRNSYQTIEKFMSRPLRIYDSVIYKVSTAYCYQFDENDINILLNDGKFYGISNLSGKYISKSDMLRYVAFTENCRVDFVKKDESGVFVYYNNKIVQDTKITVVKLSDGIQVDGDSAADKRREMLKRKRESDHLILKTLVRNTVTNILDEYGLKTDKDYRTVTFKNRDCLKSFMQKTLQDTVLKKLEDNGIVTKLYNRSQNICASSVLFTLEGLTDKESDKKESE